MDHREAGRYWEANAEAWTAAARAGYDIARDQLNTPAFLKMLPDVTGLRGLDIGCGEGHNTRLLVGRGACMTAVDIAPTFIRHAAEHEAHDPLGICYHLASAVELPFADGSFDFATAFMSLMDLPEADRALAEACRVIRPGGFFQFSITHPCFNSSGSRWLRDDAGSKIGLLVEDYFTPRHGDVEEWFFGTAPRDLTAQYEPIRTPIFHRTLSDWLNLVCDAGFAIERLGEPKPSDELVAQQPAFRDERMVAYFLHVRCRRP